ncbi:MAG: FHA domain-containing protein [bacterium]|nr:FHA domain-containing protein [bacterium]
MSEEKPLFSESDSGRHEEVKPRSAAGSRAKNQTVMLTPEMTGQVRAMLNRDPDSSAAINQVMSAASWERPGQAAAPVVPRSDASGQSITQEHPSRVPVPPYVAPSRQVSPVQVAVAPPVVGVGTGVFAQGMRTEGIQVIAHGKSSRLVGFLVSYDSDEDGELCPLRFGRWLVSSQAVDQGSYILIEEETISPLHAIIRVGKDGRIQVLDQLSEYGTAVTKAGEDEEEEISGAMVEVHHGDIVRFGKRRFVVVIIPTTSE